GRRLFRLAGANEAVLILALGGVAGLLSGVMNSIGAMAVLLPAAMATAREARLSPSKLLLPLAPRAPPARPFDGPLPSPGTALRDPHRGRFAARGEDARILRARVHVGRHGA